MSISIYEVDIYKVENLIKQYFEEIRQNKKDEYSNMFSKDSYKKYIDYCLNREVKCLCCMKNGKKIGFITFEELNFTPFFLNGEKYVFIYVIYVVPEERNKGIGKLLMKKVEEYCKEKNIKYIFLLTSLERNTYKFYEKLGYKRGYVEMFKILE